MKDFRRNQSASCGSFIIDQDETLLGFDQALEELTGWPAIEVVGHHKDLKGLGPQSNTSRSVPLYDGRMPFEPLPANIEVRINCRDGRGLDVEALFRPLNGPGERMLVTILRVLASTSGDLTTCEADGIDPLTGLLDQAAFASQLSADFAEAAVTARPMSLISLDVDHLRKVNDRWGRVGGDDVLRKLAGILRVTAEDGMRIARVGDDDFAILLTNGGRGEARLVAAAVRSKVERHRFFAGEESKLVPQVTISLGAASFPADADTEQELVERAADALNEARSMGRNRVWCYLRRPRVPVQVPVFFDCADSMLLGYMRDLSPSGIFLQTTAGIDVGMRCALAFPLPGIEGRVHVVGRVVRTVTPEVSDRGNLRVPGLGVEFERFGGSGDRRAIDSFLHERESTSLRPETGILSVQ